MLDNLKIKQKLLLINLLSILLVSTSVGFFWIYTNYTQHNSSLDKRLEILCGLVTSNVLAAVLFEDAEASNDILMALKADPAVMSAKLVTVNKKVLAEANFNKNTPNNKLYSLRNFFGENHHRQVKEIILDDTKVIASLTITYHDLEVHKTVLHAVFLTTLVVLISIIITTILVHFMQEIVTKPIRKLSSLARKVTSSNDYSLRGKKSYSDETGALTEDFNTMLDIIEQRNDNLEELVQQRTHALREKNSLLEDQILATQLAEESRHETEARFQQAFFKAPIGMALVDANFNVFSRNKRFNTLLDVAADVQIRLEKIIPEADWKNIQLSFKQLEAGNITSGEHNICCYKTNNDEMHAILSMSAVKDKNHSFRYAVVQLQDVTESRILAAELEHQATHDSLTGLANRRLLKRNLSILLNNLSESDDSHSLCILDLDQFKVVNDTCGHAAGDELLKQVADLLTDSMRSDDLVVRLGGDEFALILYQCDTEKARNIAETLRCKIEQMVFIWDNKSFHVGVSIGVVLLKPNLANDSEAIKQADSACYAAKDAGRNRVYVIDGIDQGIKERQGESLWVQRIHHALDNNEFVLFSQPIIPIQDNQGHSHAEILIRLRNTADASFISPAAFLPVAERYGLSSKIDRWVIQTMIDNLLNKRLPAGECDHYWINLSGVSLGDDEFLDFLETAIRKANLPAGVINFEITETAVITSITKASKLMLSLKTMGCNFALDDFGSGVSSFGYLKNLPVEHIKIDGMFVKDILIDEVDLIFVKSIIDIAKTMGMATVAEFVESLEIRDKLIELGADYGQGYALGKPAELIVDAV